jgi:hypothetical protein
VGEIQGYGRSWPPRRRYRRGGWLLKPGRILLLPFVALIAVGVFIAGAFGPSSMFRVAAPTRFAPSADRDCRDFATRWQAQLFYWQAGPGDPHRLDEDGDGWACELNGWF